MASSRTWRVRAKVLFPNEFPVGPYGELPQSLTPKGRIPTADAEHDGIRMLIRPAEDPPPALPDLGGGPVRDVRFDWGELVLIITDMPTADDALRLPNRSWNRCSRVSRSNCRLFSLRLLSKCSTLHLPWRSAISGR